MKVLMTADTVGGVWTIALDLAKALGEHNTTVTLATMGPAMSADQRKDASGIPNLDIVESPYRLEWMDDPWEDIQAASFWLMNLEDSVRPDIIHLNHYAFGGVPWKAPVLLSPHFCVLCWWNAVKGCPAPTQWDRYWKLVRRSLDAADMVVVRSPAVVDALASHYRHRSRVRLVDTGLDPALYRRDAKEPFILATGRIDDEARNLRALYEAAPRLAWPVHLAGDTFSTATGRFHTRGIRPLGPLPKSELASQMARAGIFAMPARYDAYGLVPLQAALSGCAMVLGDIPSLRAEWNGAAVFVEPDDEEALVDGINRLALNEDLRNHVAESAWRRASIRTADRMALGYLDAYLTLVVERARAEDRYSF